MQLYQLFAAIAVALAASTVSADVTLDVGDGTTVSADLNSTIFMGTEYDPKKCLLQFDSLECTEKDCGELNGYQLECVNLGMQDGKEKMMCECSDDDSAVCQNSTAPKAPGGTVPQFGDCSSEACVDSYGHVPTSVEERVCAEKLHCVKEINTTAAVPAQICHTCRSCIAQNDAQNKKLTDIHRFNCTAICPQEIIDSIAARNAAGVGIADDFSAVGSTSGSSTGSSSSSQAAGSSTAEGSSSKANGSSVAVMPQAAARPLVAAIVVVALAMVYAH